MDNDFQRAVRKVRMIISDVDGVFTDGTIYKGNDGAEFKRFSVLDGTGVALVKSAGLKLAIVSGRFSPATASRVKEMGLTDDCYQGGLNKITAFEELKSKHAVPDEGVAFIGDDLIDLPVMEKVGLPIAVANAAEPVKKMAKYVTVAKGGEGAFREAVEMILKIQGVYETSVEKLRQKILDEEPA